MEVVKGNLDGTPVEQPVMYSVDATKCQSIEEMGMLMNALGLGMSMEYAEQNNLKHLLVRPE